MILPNPPAHLNPPPDLPRMSPRPINPRAPSVDLGHLLEPMVRIQSYIILCSASLTALPGSMGSHNTAQSEQHPPESSETSQAGMRISVPPAAQQNPGSPPLSASKLKKPALPRRATSRRQIPHRGQEFSVDDDVSEVEEEHPPRQPTTPGVASPMMGPLRRQTSTVRRRITAQPTPLPRVDSQDEEDNVVQIPKTPQDQEVIPGSSGEEGTLQDVQDEDDDGDISDAESFTLKDRQQAINETHPFGIRIWKPALYKKNRSVEKSAEGDIHSTPGGSVSNWLWMFNICWTLFFGWWLAIACLLSAIVAYTFWFAPGATDYGSVFLGLSGYLFWPFGQFVRLESEESYVEEDEGEGRSISEYEQWQSGDLEHGKLFFGPVNSRSLVGRRRNSMDSSTEQDSLLGRTARGAREDNIMGRNKRRYFGRGQWNIGRVIFFVFFYFFITPLLLLASLICWMMVFWIPMGRVLLILWYHMRRRPLALSFHSDASYSRNASAPSSSILLCTYRAVGTKYWKYTLDGTNIFLINLLGIVLFTILDYFVLDVALGMHTGLANPALLFILGLLSIIPLAYFIGQAVASISAQSSMGLGAAVNAFFSTIVEVYLYCVALNEGKGQLVEGSIIGSIFAGILLLPGLSMCFGGIKRKTQRFNVKSAGVTSTMLLFAVIAAFGPTLFYQIYGSVHLSLVLKLASFWTQLTLFIA
jgi:Ca2+:H+ antiporter